MNKNWMSAIIKIIFPVAFNIVFFLQKGSLNPPAVWVAYAFIHFSYLALLATPLFITRGKDADSVAYPLYVISGFYFGLTLIVSCVYLFLGSLPGKYMIIANTVLTLLYIIIFLAHAILGKKTEEQEAERFGKVQFINQCCKTLDLLKADFAPTDNLYEKITEAYDLIHSSPIASDKSVARYEEEATSALQELQSLDHAQYTKRYYEQLDRLIKAFRQRNALLKQGSD